MHEYDRLLRDGAGYATGHFGKWHMGGQRDVARAPAIAAYGFDASLTNFEGMGPKLLPLTLRELRSRLLSHGLSTIGLKAELQQRLANAMLHERVKHKSWDPASQSWV